MTALHHVLLELLRFIFIGRKIFLSTPAAIPNSWYSNMHGSPISFWIMYKVSIRKNDIDIQPLELFRKFYWNVWKSWDNFRYIDLDYFSLEKTAIALLRNFPNKNGTWNSAKKMKFFI